MSEEVTFSIDGKIVRAKAGIPVLKAALDNDIYIPNLCYVEDLQLVRASCRLCFVEVEGKLQPVTSCTEPVVEGMVVRTDSPRVRRLQRTAAELLISRHHVDCKNCERNKNCELQKIAIFLRVKLKGGRFRKLEKNLPIDYSHPCLVYDANKCVLCGRCVKVCNLEGVAAFNFSFRGAKTLVLPSEQTSLIEFSCNACGECAKLCPTGALLLREEPHGKIAEEQK